MEYEYLLELFVYNCEINSYDNSTQFANPHQHLKDMFLEIQIKMGKYITCIIIITHHKT